jgi:hypothetical protein
VQRVESILGGTSDVLEQTTPSGDVNDGDRAELRPVADSEDPGGGKH